MLHLFNKRVAVNEISTVPNGAVKIILNTPMFKIYKFKKSKIKTFFDFLHLKKIFFSSYFKAHVYLCLIVPLSSKIERNAAHRCLIFNLR